jgi:hypothetical protein
LASVCQSAALDYGWRPTGAHADDELVVETAINGNADVLATFNVRDMKMAGQGFGIAVLRPGALLRRLAS